MVISEIILQLSQACRPADLPDWVESLRLENQAFLGARVPEAALRELKRNWDLTLLAAAGILVGGRSGGNTSRLHPGLCGEDKMWLPLAERGEFFDVVTNAGCLGQRNWPIESLHRDDHFQRALNETGVVFVVPTVADLALFQALGLAASTAFGWDRVAAEPFQGLLHEIDRLDPYLPAARTAASATAASGLRSVSPDPDAGNGDARDPGRPHNQAAELPPGGQDAEPVAHVLPLAEQAANQRHLQPSMPASPQSLPGSSRMDDFSSGAYDFDASKKIVLVAWSLAELDSAEPPGYEAIVAHLCNLTKYVSVPVDEVGIWRGSSEGIEALKFAARYGDRQRLRALIGSAINTTDPIVDAPRPELPSIKAAAAAFYRLASDENATPDNKERARQHFLRALRQRAVEPLTAAAEQTTDVVSIVQSFQTAAYVHELFDKTTRRQLRRGTKASEQDADSIQAETQELEEIIRLHQCIVQGITPCQPAHRTIKRIRGAKYSRS